MIKEERFLNLLNCLKNNQYRSSEELANKINVSSKTIRNDIKELNSILQVNGAEIVAKPKHGNLLCVYEEKAFKNVLQELKSKTISNQYTLGDSKQRSLYILSYLLSCEKYVKADDICDKMYISKSTLMCDLKQVKEMLAEFNLNIISRPNYGIKVQGDEFNRRLCIAKYLINSVGTENEENTKNDKMILIEKILLKELLQSSIVLSETALKNLVIHILVSILRIKNNSLINSCEMILDKERYKEEVDVASKIIIAIEKKLNIIFPNSEKIYIAIHLAGKKIIGLNNSSNPNQVITSEVSEIAFKMLGIVNKSLNINLTDDLDLIMMLSLHLISLMVRMEYDMTLKNPLLNEIKSKQSEAYMIAKLACSVLKEKYNKTVSEDEIAYIALHFGLALEKRREVGKKKNILIVCSSGRGSAQLLIYKIMSEFGKYIDKTDTTDLYGLNNYNFEGIDYIITTIPIMISIPVPILEINYFFEDRDIKAIRTLLTNKKTSTVIKYFSKELFLTNVKINSKEEIIRYMCDEISKVKNVPENLFELTLEREKLAQTEFGNGVALPHPSRAVCDETFVCVALLDKPIIWSKRKVQLVLLLCIEDNKKKDLSKFYQVVSKCVMDKAYVKEIIKKKDYLVLSEIISKIEGEVKENNG